MFVRRKALACPCCGAALSLTAGTTELSDDSEVNEGARFMLRIASWLRDKGHIHLEPIEHSAERMLAGSLISEVVPE